MTTIISDFFPPPTNRVVSPKTNSNNPVSVTKDFRKISDHIVFANPVKSGEAFQMRYLGNAPFGIYINDISGKQVAYLNNNKSIITVPALNAGLYFISTNSSDVSDVCKLIVY